MAQGRTRKNAPPASDRSGGARVALGVSGGIAAYKAAEVVRGLSRAGCRIHVIMTAHACEFITPLTLQTLSGNKVLSDQWDLSTPAEIQHVALARDLDLFLVAPATANTIGKLANGIADDFLTTFYLAVTARVAVAPAMNLRMWNHPATQRNVETLRDRGTLILEPGSGDLACGDEGMGRMAEPERIVQAALRLLKKKVHPRLRAAGSS